MAAIAVVHLEPQWPLLQPSVPYVYFGTNLPTVYPVPVRVGLPGPPKKQNYYVNPLKAMVNRLNKISTYRLGGVRNSLFSSPEGCTAVKNLFTWMSKGTDLKNVRKTSIHFLDFRVHKRYVRGM